MRCTNTTIGTKRMPSFAPWPRCNLSAKVNTACLAIQVLPVPGPARTKTGCAGCKPIARPGEATSNRPTRSRTSFTFHSAGIDRTLSCASVAVEMCSV